LNFFRSSLFGMLVALFVVAGYGWSLSGQCCLGERGLPAAQIEGAHSEEAPAQDDGCQCVCHQIVFHGAAEIVKVAGLVLVSEDSQVVTDEVAPDAVPLGIEYPPQVA